MEDVGEYTLYGWESDDGRWYAVMHRLHLKQAIEAFRAWDRRGEYVFIAKPGKVAPETVARHLGYAWKTHMYCAPLARLEVA